MQNIKSILTLKNFEIWLKNVIFRFPQNVIALWLWKNNKLMHILLLEQWLINSGVIFTRGGGGGGEGIFECLCNEL